jgi:pimeloyl-ACP methyl ester carboxylesterase
VGIGPLVLFLHGFPDNFLTFDAQLTAIAKAGYRAVSVSLRGYEPASQPGDNDYSQNSIAADIVAIVDELGLEKVHLVGHDWGAAIAYTVGAIAPEKLHSLVTIALPHPGRFLNNMIFHPRQLRLSWYIMFFQLAGIADYFVQRNDYQFIRNRWRDWSPNWTVPEQKIAQIIDSLKQPGVMNAALKYYRTALSLGAFTPSARSAARFQVRVPTLAISGSDDGCIDSSVFEKMMYKEDFPNGLDFHRMNGVGHFPHLERPDEVNELILFWINKHQPKHLETGK